MLVSVLGPVRVQSAAGPLRLGGTRQRAVLAMLALRADQVVSQDFLVDGLWGATPPAGAANTVQAYVSRLRKILRTADPADPPVDVLRRRPGYLLQIEPEMIDLHRFERLVRDGVAALPAGRAGPRACCGKRWACGVGRRWLSSPTNPSRRPRSPGYRNSTWPRWPRGSPPIWRWAGTPR